MATAFAPISRSSAGREQDEEIRDVPTVSPNVTITMSGLAVKPDFIDDGGTNLPSGGTSLRQMVTEPDVVPLEQDAEDGTSHPPLAFPERRVTLQSFEGTVQEIRGQEFDGVLFDLTDKTRPEELVSFTFDEVSEQDRALVTPGSVFYWFIGYDVSRLGQLTRTSRIRFRRLPVWTQSQLQSLRTGATHQFDDIFRPPDAI